VAKTATKRIGREGGKRRAAGWTLLILGLLVAGVWVASGWWSVVSYGSQHRWAVRDRAISAERIEGDASFARRDGWTYAKADPAVVRQLRLDLEANGPGADYRVRRLTVPGLLVYVNQSNYFRTIEILRVDVWPIPLLLWTPAALLLRSGFLARRRANTNACAKCGYSLAGLTSDSPCPECGGAKERVTT
jgi:hypothetical protein